MSHLPISDTDQPLTLDTQTLLHQIHDATTPAELLPLIEQLAAHATSAAIDGLIHLLHHHHPAIGAAAVAGLVHCSHKAVDPLIAQFLNSRDHGAQAYIVLALVQIGDARALNLLLDVVGVDVANHCQGSVRRVAARGLGRIGRRSSDPVLLQAILEKLTWAVQNAEDWALRYAAIVSLQEIGTADAITPSGNSEAIAILQQAGAQELDRVVQERLKRAVAVAKCNAS